MAPVEIRAWSPQNDPLKTSFSQDRQIDPPKLTADWQNRGPSDPNSERAVHFSTAGLELTNPGCGPSHSRATYLSNRVHGGQSQNDRRLGWAFSRNNQMKRVSVGHFRRTEFTGPIVVYLAEKSQPAWPDVKTGRHGQVKALPGPSWPQQGCTKRDSAGEFPGNPTAKLPKPQRVSAHQIPGLKPKEAISSCICL